MINERSEVEIWESGSRASMLSITIGRAVNTVFAVRPTKLREAISRQLSNDSQFSPSSFGSEDLLDYSLWFIMNFVKDSLKRDSNLDELLVALVQHWLKNRGMKSGGHSVLLIDWLFQKDEIFEFVATKYIDIIMKNNDRFLALAWCTFTRTLVEYETLTNQFHLKGMNEHCIFLIILLCSCVPKLLQLVIDGSLIQDGNELPTRLALCAADSLLAITIALTMKTDKLSGNPKRCNSEMIQDTRTDLTSILWNQVDALIPLLRKLNLWNNKSRPLHSFGVEKVLNWMRKLKAEAEYDVDDQNTRNVHNGGKLLLSSCWKHYCILLHLEDRKIHKLYQELIDQYLGGIQRSKYAYDDDSDVIVDDAIDTRKFFINCICLLLGRLDVNKLEHVMSENMERLSQILLQQMRSEDDDLVGTAVMVFKGVILKPESFENLQIDNEMNGVLALLFDLLDERHTTSKPVVLLIAEYCAKNLENLLNNVIDRIDSKNTHQRRNALLVVSELVDMSQNSSFPLENNAWEEMVNKVLSCLSDEDQEIRDKASSLFTKIDPVLVLSTLFELMYSSNNKIHIVAIRTIKGMLTNHKHEFDVIRLFINCMSASNVDRKAWSKNETDPAHQVVLHWSENVEKWNVLIPQLVEMVFLNPGNPEIVRFMSYISEHLAEESDIVLYHVLTQLKNNNSIERSSNPKHSLFEHLSPLLIIRLLPLKLFDNASSSIMYGKVSKDCLDIKFEDAQDSIVGNLFKRSYDTSQFEEVRKLSAELCGRIHPQVLIPFVSSSLKNESFFRNMVNIRAALFSLCTSLAVRGKETLNFCSSSHIIPSFEKILSLPCVENDEVFKAQHGCIDCLALLICAEMQPTPQSSFTDYVLNGLLSSRKTNTFRICMANSLISACQKISSDGKKPFAERILPLLINSISEIGSLEVTNACFEVMFSSVYHLKCAVAPFSRRLFQSSVYALNSESKKVRLAGAKLMAAILSGGDDILEGISDDIVDAKSALLNALSSDSTLEIQRLCCHLISFFSSS